MKKKVSRKKNSKTIANNLSGALGLGFGQFGFPNPAGNGAQLSQVETLFKNQRWYLVSNFRQLLSEAYVEIGLLRTIVDIPVYDAFRGGVDVSSKQLDEGQVQDLMNEMERKNDIQVCIQSNIWDRLFGGGGTVIITEQDARMPLDITTLGPGAKLEFRAVDMWELFWSRQNVSDYSAEIDYLGVLSPEFYDYYGVPLHNSRFLKLVGIQAPSFIRPRLRGWGLSVTENLIRSINQYLKATDLIFEVLDEFKIDVYRLKNLTSTLFSPAGEAKVRQRVATANAQKNYQSSIVLDSEDEYTQKQLSFAGIAECMEGIRMQIASDMRMPLTKIFGISAAGFSSGQDDIENYNSMIESEIRQKTKFHLLRMIEIRCMNMFGFVPDDLSIDFKPLRVLSAEQEENVRTQKFNRLLAAKQANEITSLEFRNACNRDNLLSIQLDTSIEVLGDENQEQEDNEEDDVKKPEAKDPKSTLDPKEAKNSLEYDMAAYEADGGDDQFSQWHQREVGKDKALWKKADDIAKGKWQLRLYLYKKWGGPL